MGSSVETQPHNRRKTDHSEKVSGVRASMLNRAMIVFAVLMSVLFLAVSQKTSDAFERFEQASDDYVVSEQAATDMMEGSSALTTQVRLYAIRGEQSHLDGYCDEVASGRRENAVAVLEEQTRGDARSSDYLRQALSYSSDLMQVELHAAKLVAQGRGDDLSRYGDVFDDVEIPASEAALSDDEKVALGTAMLFDEEYQGQVDRISWSVSQCKESLLQGILEVRDQEAATMHRMLLLLRVSTVLLLLAIIAAFASVAYLVLRPLRRSVANISQSAELPMNGAYELRYMAQAYNVMREDNMEAHAKLLRKAERDHLTDLYNRGVFESTLSAVRGDTALLLIDFDYFKSVNDTYGHDVGDAMLKKVARLLVSEFRMTDYPCRIGGDEFAVVMVDVSPELKGMVAEKIESLRAALQDTSDGLPAATLSVGVAFNDGSLDSAAFFKRADETLYKVKESGRDNYAFAD